MRDGSHTGEVVPCLGSIEQARHTWTHATGEYKTGILLSCRCSPHLIEFTLRHESTTVVRIRTKERRLSANELRIRAIQQQ